MGKTNCVTFLRSKLSSILGKKNKRRGQGTPPPSYFLATDIFHRLAYRKLNFEAAAPPPFAPFGTGKKI